MTTDIHKIAYAVIAELKGIPEIAAAYLLGSAATGRLRPDSDIDIALLLDSKQSISLKTRLELAGRQELRLGRTIDIGIITDQNLVYAYEAITKGIRILTNYPAFVESTEMRILGNYLTYKEDIQEVEAAYYAA